MDISGIWYNELGSTMTLSILPNGTVEGNYTTAVSATGCAQGQYPLLGNTDTETGGQGLAFSVCWNGCGSITAWCGKAHTLGVNQQLTLFWLLTSESQPNWESTIIGQDSFTRTPPNPEQLTNKLQSSRPAHP